MRLYNDDFIDDDFIDDDFDFDNKTENISDNRKKSKWKVYVCILLFVFYYLHFLFLHQLFLMKTIYIFSNVFL